MKKKENTYLISWAGEISGGKSLEIIKIISDLNQEGKIPRLLICSTGGSPRAAFGFYEYVKIHKLKFETFIVGYADSSAIIIFLSTPLAFRFCTKSATMFLHRGSKQFKDTSLNDIELEKAFKDTSFNNDMYSSILARNTKLTKKKALVLMTKEIDLRASDITRFGFANVKR